MQIVDTDNRLNVCIYYRLAEAFGTLPRADPILPYIVNLALIANHGLLEW